MNGEACSIDELIGQTFDEVVQFRPDKYARSDEVHFRRGGATVYRLWHRLGVGRLRADQAGGRMMKWASAMQVVASVAVLGAGVVLATHGHAVLAFLLFFFGLPSVAFSAASEAVPDPRLAGHEALYDACKMCLDTTGHGWDEVERACRIAMAIADDARAEAEGR